jgi:hypothetical protein
MKYGLRFIPKGTLLSARCFSRIAGAHPKEALA